MAHRVSAVEAVPAAELKTPFAGVDISKLRDLILQGREQRAAASSASALRDWPLHGRIAMLGGDVHDELQLKIGHVLALADLLAIAAPHADELFDGTIGAVAFILQDYMFGIEKMVDGATSVALLP